MIYTDPLTVVYDTLQLAIWNVYGFNFPVLDDFPNPTEFKKQLPAANITYVSGGTEDALMRASVPHSISKNQNGTFQVRTEVLRMDYLIQVSFFAETQGVARQLGHEFFSYINEKIYLPVPEDKEKIQVLPTGPLTPPRGEPDVYQVDATYRCRGRLLKEETVNAVDVRNLRFTAQTSNKK